jgi:hypothetical protein
MPGSAGEVLSVVAKFIYFLFRALYNKGAPNAYVFSVCWACPALTVVYSRAGVLFSFVHAFADACFLKPCLLGPRCNFCRMSASVRLFNFSPMKAVFSFIHLFLLWNLVVCQLSWIR